MTENIKENLAALPEAICKKEQKILELGLKKEELNLKKKTIEAQTKYEVLNCVNDEGKKAFSNQVQRDQEEKNRLSDDDDYQVVLEDLDTNYKDLENEKINLGFLKRSFRAAEAMSRLGE